MKFKMTFLPGAALASIGTGSSWANMLLIFSGLTLMYIAATD